MDIRAVLFDINGTLVDISTDENMEEIYRAIGHFLTYQGITLHRWEVRDRYFALMQAHRLRSPETFVEWDAITLWHDFIQAEASDYTRALSPEYLAQLPRFLAELHRGSARRRLRLYPQVQETLELLRGRYAMAVVTDAQNVYALPEMEAVGLRKYFDPIIVSGNYGYRKPDARLFYHALDGLAVRPEQALFLGNDLYRDIYGAQQVGMKAIHITYQQSSPPEQNITPDYVIAGIEELPQALDYFLALP